MMNGQCLVDCDKKQQVVKHVENKRNITCTQNFVKILKQLSVVMLCFKYVMLCIESLKILSHIVKCSLSIYGLGFNNLE